MTANQRPSHGWGDKFAAAFRGVVVGIRGESSFYVHGFFTVVVPVLAGILGLSRWEWCLLLLCITIVLSAEMFNSSIERLAQALHSQPHPKIADALDVASGAVLLAAVGAAIVGLIVLTHRIWELVC